MPNKPHTFPEIKIIMISFDMIPTSDQGILQMTRYDLSRMKRNTKAKNALARSNAYRVVRQENRVGIEFLDMTSSEEKRKQLRVVYELIPPFR